MSDRDDLAATLWNLPINVIDWAEVNRMADGCDDEYTEARDYVLQQADSVLAAGWRKKPDRVALTMFMRAVSPVVHEPLATEAAEKWADAILALLDGPTETGGK